MTYSQNGLIYDQVAQDYQNKWQSLVAYQSNILSHYTHELHARF